ncbi:MAG: hypothetical protein PHV74_15300 [Dehalococcoidia bacterium]|nr:hypothetical protein [Dehalococcoidia bacterium]
MKKPVIVIVLLVVVILAIGCNDSDDLPISTVSSPVLTPSTMPPETPTPTPSNTPLPSATAIPTPSPAESPTPTPTQTPTACEIQRDAIQVAISGYHDTNGEWPTADGVSGDISWDKLIPDFLAEIPSLDSTCEWQVNNNPEGTVCLLKPC